MRQVVCAAGVICALLACSLSAQQPTDKELVLSATSLGSLSLSPNGKVSVAILEKAFPGARVSYDIREGDSPDFHCFIVTSAQGEQLFMIRSFIDDGMKSRPDGTNRQIEVPIHLLQVTSRRIRDSYGLRVGDRVADVIRVRGEKLEYGAAHHDVYIGADKIFYSMDIGRDKNSEAFMLAEAKRVNSRITSISWPHGAWE
jgi:hypothetical protein